MAHLFGDYHLYILLGLLVIFRNFFGAFPEPDPSLKTGFGSGSPGYKMVYSFARGMTGDLKAIGFDTKSLGLKLKTGAEAQIQIPEDK